MDSVDLGSNIPEYLFRRNRWDSRNFLSSGSVNALHSFLSKDSSIGSLIRNRGNAEAKLLAKRVKAQSPASLGLIASLYCDEVEGLQNLSCLAEGLSASVAPLDKEARGQFGMPNSDQPLYLIYKYKLIAHSPLNPSENLELCPNPLLMLGTPNGCQQACNQAICPCKEGDYITNPFLVSEDPKDYLYGLEELLHRSEENKALYKKATRLLGVDSSTVHIVPPNFLMRGHYVGSPSNLDDIDLVASGTAEEVLQNIASRKADIKASVELRALTVSTKKNVCSKCIYKPVCFARKKNHQIRGCSSQTTSNQAATIQVKGMLRQALGLEDGKPLPSVSKRSRHIISSLQGEVVKLQLWSRRQDFRIEGVTYSKALLSRVAELKHRQSSRIAPRYILARLLPRVRNKFNQDRLSLNLSRGIANPVNLLVTLVFNTSRWDRHRCNRIIIPLVDLLPHAPTVEKVFYEKIPNTQKDPYYPGINRYLEDFINQPTWFQPGYTRVPRFTYFEKVGFDRRIIFDSRVFDLTSMATPATFISTLITLGSPPFYFMSKVHRLTNFWVGAGVIHCPA